MVHVAGHGIEGSGPSIPRSGVVVEALHALAAVVGATLSNDMVNGKKPIEKE